MGTEKGPEFYTGKGYLKGGAREHNMLVYNTAYNLLPPRDEYPKIIDLGCGVGYFATLITEHHYTGIDFSAKVIEIAKEINPNKKFIQANLLDETVYSYIYDKSSVYVCLEALEHIEKDIEVLRTIPSGSPIIISVPNRDFISHVRFFKNQNEIIERYKDIIEFDNCEWKILNTNPKKNAQVFMFRARRKI